MPNNRKNDSDADCFEGCKSERMIKTVKHVKFMVPKCWEQETRVRDD